MSNMFVIIDMQNGFIDQKTKFIVPTIKKLQSYFSAKKIPIVLMQFINPVENSPYRRLLQWNKLSSSPEIDIIQDLLDLYTIIIPKSTNSAFNEKFEHFIHLYAIDTLYLCGVSTESCVLKTALDAFDKNLTPIVIADACYSTSGEKSHKVGLYTIRKNIGEKQIQDSGAIMNID